MPGLALISRVPKHFVKTVTFDNGVTAGATATPDTIATIVGRVLIQRLCIACTTSLDNGGTAVVQLGTANNTNGLIAVTTETLIDALEFWHDATPETEISDPIVDEVVQANIILTTTTANVLSGVLEFSFDWLPRSVDGSLS